MTQQYKVVRALNITDLTIEVDRYLQAGWRAQGGVAVNSGDTYFQAVVRDVATLGPVTTNPSFTSVPLDSRDGRWRKGADRGAALGHH